MEAATELALSPPPYPLATIGEEHKAGDRTFDQNSPTSPVYSTPPGSPPSDPFSPSDPPIVVFSRPVTSRSSSNSSSTSTSPSLSHTHRNRPPPEPLLLDHSAYSSPRVTFADPEVQPDPLTAIPPPGRGRANSGDHWDQSSTASTASTHLQSGMSAAPWVADQRARSPLAEGGPSADNLSPKSSSFGLRPPASPLSNGGGGPRPQVTHRNIPNTVLTPPAQLVSPPVPVRSPSYSHTLASPCFVHSHLDNSLSDYIKRDAAAAADLRKKKNNLARKRASSVPNGAPVPEGDDDSDTASEGALEEEDEDEEDGPSLTRQLAETAVSVREMSKQLGRARVISHIQSIMIITKARDNHLIRLTRELALWLMQTPRNGRDRGLVVYVDNQLRKSKRFDAEGMQRDHPDLFRPLPRRYSRTSSSSSLAGSVFESAASAKKMTPLSQLNSQLAEAIKKNGGDQFKRAENDEGQLRYWTNDMCTKSPHLFDFVITLGGDGTVLYASWLFQHVVPPVIPFALGSLGFLTNFDFSTYAYTLNNAIDKGIRVNLRMRFTCTVYRAIEGEENKKRRAIRSGKTGGIFMNSLTTDGWEAIENGGLDTGHREAGKKDKEIKCFSTRPVESFEVLNDLVVDRGPSPYVSLLELFGDEHHMTTVQADGLTVSTPTGSTAYSLSAGGSLVHPEIPALLITPICPHTLSFRPMLLPDSMELRICVPYNSRSTAWASFDGRGRVELRQGDHIKVTASQYPFPTVCADKQSTDWFQSIQRTLKWNERQRQKSFVILEEGRKKSSSRKQSATDDTVLQAGHTTDATAKAREDFGDEEDDDDEDDEGSGDETDPESEEETFDIDDLSSENPTNASSPVNHPNDPIVGTIPDLSRNSSISSQSYLHDREISSASSVDLQENTADRFRDQVPKPPKLSSRHSHNDHAVARDQSPFRPPGSSHHRMSDSTVRRRARGEEGDRDHIRESLDVKRTVGGTRRRMRSASREKTKSQQPDPVQESANESEVSIGRAFAVLGQDDESSLDDSDGTHDLA